MRDQSSLWLFGPVWFFVALLPRSSIVPSLELMNDYKTYAASIGILFLFASLLVWLMRRQPTWLKQTTFIALFCLLGFLTYQRNKVWATEKDFLGRRHKKSATQSTCTKCVWQRVGKLRSTQTGNCALQKSVGS